MNGSILHHPATPISPPYFPSTSSYPRRTLRGNWERSALSHMPDTTYYRPTVVALPDTLMFVPSPPFIPAHRWRRIPFEITTLYVQPRCYLPHPDLLLLLRPPPNYPCTIHTIGICCTVPRSLSILLFFTTLSFLVVPDFHNRSLTLLPAF